jgi:hypothetical protein
MHSLSFKYGYNIAEWLRALKGFTLFNEPVPVSLMSIERRLAIEVIRRPRTSLASL